MIMERFKAFVEATRVFATEVVGELRKVVWPSKEKLIRLTTVVVSMVLVVAGFLWLWDLGLGWVMNAMFQRG